MVSVPLIKGNPFCDGKILSLEVKHHMGCSFVSIPNEIFNNIFKRITGVSLPPTCNGILVILLV